MEAHVQQSDSAALSILLGEDLPREPLLRWLGSNVLRLIFYLGAASFAAAVFSVLTSEGPDPLLGLAIIYLMYGGYLGIPGTLVWLLVVAMLPPEWSKLRRRTVALAMSPIIQVILLAWLLSWRYFVAAAIFGLLLPAGSAFVVRLRGRMPSSRWPPGDG
jgi:hypothetical protein